MAGTQIVETAVALISTGTYQENTGIAHLSTGIIKTAVVLICTSTHIKRKTAMAHLSKGIVKKQPWLVYTGTYQENTQGVAGVQVSTETPPPPPHDPSTNIKNPNSRLMRRYQKKKTQ